MNHINADNTFPNKILKMGIKETAHKNISPIRIKLDKGTARKLVNKKSVGNW